DRYRRKGELHRPTADHATATRVAAAGGHPPAPAATATAAGPRRARRGRTAGAPGDLRGRRGGRCDRAPGPDRALRPLTGGRRTAATPAVPSDRPVPSILEDATA